MKNSDRDLLQDLFPDSSREATLLRGGRVMRRRRFVHRAARVAPFIAVIALAGALVLRHEQPAPQSAGIPATVTKKSLTDEQLFALFPGVPKAIMTVNGQKRLIFPRPADAVRYVGRAVPETRT